jgi:hypothetical protein
MDHKSLHQMDITIMNRKDFSVEIKIIDPQSKKEKIFDVPMLCDNIIWFQLLMAEELNHSAVITASNTVLKH